MVKVFQPDDTVYTSNGDIVVQPLKAVVHKEDDGDFYLDFEAGARYSDWLDGGNIVVATTPQGEQAFRIRDNQKTRDKVILKAKHVYYDAEDYFIQYCEVSNPDFDPSVPGSALVDCGMALGEINAATDRTSLFTVGSDIARETMAVDAYEVENKSLLEAVNEISAKFGNAHIVRDNWDIQVKATIGQDNGVTISYGKNLVGITRSENWDNVCTKLLPVGKDGIMLNSLEADPDPDDAYISVEDAPVIITRTVTFEQDIEQEEGETEEAYKQRLIDDLLIQGGDYLQEHGSPVLCYELKAEVVQISDIGDTVKVKDEELGINVMTHVVSYDYDVIQGRYIGMTLASHNEKKLSKLITNITEVATTNAMKAAKKEVEAVQEDLNGVKDEVSDLQDDVSDIQGDLRRNIMTAWRNAELTNLTVNDYAEIPMTNSVSTGSKLTFTNGRIKIGAGVSRILVSGRFNFTSTSIGATVYARIVKNSYSYNNTLAWVYSFCASDKALMIDITPTLVSVSENDEIFIMYYTANQNAKIVGNAYGAITSLTVEVI